MNNMLEHKGYCGTVEYSATDGVLFGKVLGIKGLISYEGDSVADLRTDFESAVNDYLEMCTKDKIKPQKPYQGKFNVSVSPELHRSLAVYSASHGQTLNSVVEDAIRRLLIL